MLPSSRSPSPSPSPPPASPPPLDPALLKDPDLQLGFSTTAADNLKSLQSPKEIRRKSLEWMLQKPPPLSYPYRPFTFVTPRPEEMKTINAPPYDGAYVIYVVVEVEDGYATVLATDQALVGKDRPDLYRMRITKDSKDLLNPGEVCPENYYPGDAIVVKTMQPRPGADLPAVCKSFDGIFLPEHHKFWMVGEFYLFDRCITHNYLVYKMGIKEALRTKSGEPREDARKFWKNVAIVQNHNVCFRMDPEFWRNFGVYRLEYEKLTIGKILTPLFQPIDPIIFLEMVRQVTGEPVHSHVPPTIISLDPATPATDHLIKQILSTPTLFRTKSCSPETLSILAKAIRLGVSGKVTMENKNRDALHYCTKIHEVQRTRKGPNVKFSIKRLDGAPRISEWMRLTNFILRTKTYSFAMKVLDAKYKKETSQFTSKELLVTASLNSKQPNLQRDVQGLEGKNVIIFQEIQENKHHLKFLPTQEELEEIQMDSPFKEVLERLLGKLGSKPEDIGERETDPQSGYITAMTTSNHPAIAVNACFRGGKTTAITSAIQSLATSSPDGIHIATATTNKSVAVMVKMYMSKHGIANAVRIVSRTTNEHSDRSVRTEIDFPTLWRRVFRAYIQSKIDAAESTDDLLSQSALYHLSEEKQNIYDENDEAIHPFDLFDTFLKIYKPKVIFGTVFAITESLVEGLLKDQRTSIQTVQFDDANRLALADFYSLGVRCPTARFGFLGDTRQLPPFADLELPWTLKQMAVGEVLRNVLKMFPSLQFKTAHGESTELVGLCSNLFYHGKLSWNREPFFLSTDLDEQMEQTFGSGNSLQILDLSGSFQEAVDTSLINKKEAELAVKLAEKLQDYYPRASIAITTYYKSQAGRVSSKVDPDDDFYIGTVDCSQDFNFDINIVLTTRTSNFKDSKIFLSSEERLNVALSRARSHCFLFTVRHSAEALDLWKKLFQKVSVDFVHDAEEFVARF